MDEGLKHRNASGVRALGVAGAVAWIMGSIGVGGKTGTVLLIVGVLIAIGVLAGSFMATGESIPTASGTRRNLTVLLVSEVLMLIVAAIVPAIVGDAGLIAPLLAAVVGLHLVPASGMFGESRYLLTGWFVLLLGVAGIVMYIAGAGDAVTLAVVGLGSGVVLDVAASTMLSNRGIPQAN